jgi:peroxiredoxin
MLSRVFDRTKSFPRVQRGTSHSAILTVLLICSVILNLLLARKVRDVSETSRLLQLQLNSPILVAGSRAPEFSAKTAHGNRESLNYADVQVPTVLYVFTPDCHWCARNLENIKHLASLTSNKFRFLGVALSDRDLDNYLMQSNMPFSVYRTVSEDVKIAYGLNSTPTTIVISPEAKVLQYWRGAYSGEMKNEVELFFQLTLPGIGE